MDERAKKRKADLLQEEGSDIEGVEREQPKQGLKQAVSAKKQTRMGARPPSTQRAEAYKKAKTDTDKKSFG